MIRFKKYIKKILIGFIALVGLITAIAVPSFAYSEDNSGNLVSDNLYSIGSYSNTMNGVTMNISNQTLTLNGTSTARTWDNRWDLKITLNPGTYTMQWFTNYTENDIGFGIFKPDSDYANFYILNTQRYRTFTISESTTFYTMIWWSRSNMTFDNVKVSCMVYVGSYKAYTMFEPYGATYYSQENYNNALLDNYGLFRLCSSIKLTLTWTDGSNKIDTYNWDSILSLISDKSYVNCVNGVFSYGNQALSRDYLNGTYSATAMWQFNFNGIYPLVKQYPYMLGSGYVSRYQIVDNKGSLFAYDSFPNDSSYIDLTQYQNKQIGYIQLFTGPVGAGSTVDTTSLYFDNSYDVAYTKGYENGKIDGYEDGRDYGETIGYENGKNDGYDSGYNQGVKDGESKDFATNGFKTLIGSIFNFPINMIRSVFNFDFMGINIASLITFIISIVIVIFIVKKFKK